MVQFEIYIQLGMLWKDRLHLIDGWNSTLVQRGMGLMAAFFKDNLPRSYQFFQNTSVP